MKTVIETRKSKRLSQIEKELSILQKIVHLFEIVKDEDSLSNMKKEFLADQRSVRQMHVFEVDQNDLPCSSNQISNSVQCLNQSGSISGDIFNEMVEYEDDDLIELFDCDDSPDFLPSNSEAGISIQKIQICDADLDKLSKCGGSFREMEKALSIGIKAAGGDPKNFAVSKANLCKRMNNHRASVKSHNLDEIASGHEKVMLLFDGKKFAKINEKHVGKDSRMVAVCHTQAKDVALGLPVLESSQAQAYVKELIEFCEKFNLRNRVVGLVCDTTATNTGGSNGVLTVFEDEIKTNVLNILCRHHIQELNLSSAMRAALGEIEAPTITLFETLKVAWPRIKERGYQYQQCEQPILNTPSLRSLYNNAKKTLVGHAKSKHIRDDYAELNDLCLKFFGIKTHKGFMVPGSISKARWMAKAIYALKVYLFRYELDLDDEFVNDLMEFALFVTIIYCKHWNRSVNALDAPSNDLTLIKELQQYSNHNRLIANAVLNSFFNHLWYLGEELIALAFFSDKVSIEDKNRMRIKLGNSVSRTTGPKFFEIEKLF